MKETFYFPHDYNAKSDKKIKRLIAKYGMRGYGCYWSIIEDLYNNANALQLDYDCIAFDLREDIDLVKSIINDFDLFVIEADEFYSNSVKKRLEERDAKSAIGRENARKRWDNKNATAMQLQCKPNAIKEKKRKEKKEESIETLSLGSLGNVSLTQEQLDRLYKDYPRELVNEYIEKLSLYIPNAKTKYKDHNAVVRNWLNRDGYKKSEGTNVLKMDYEQMLDYAMTFATRDKWMIEMKKLREKMKDETVAIVKKVDIAMQQRDVKKEMDLLYN